MSLLPFTVSVVNISGDQLAMDVTAASGLSVLADNYFAGWTAKHAGESATVQGSHTNPTMGDAQQHAVALLHRFLTGLVPGDVIQLFPPGPLQIDDHILVGEPADWRTSVSLQLKWETEAESALAGRDAATARRAAPRAVLGWQVSPATVAARAQLDMRLRAAFNVLGDGSITPGERGAICAPLHCLPSYLSANVAATDTVLVVAASALPWNAGMYAVIFSPSDLSDVWTPQVSAVAADGLTLTLTEGAPWPLAAGEAVYPLMFGRLLTLQEERLWSPDIAEIPLLLEGELPSLPVLPGLLAAMRVDLETTTPYGMSLIDLDVSTSQNFLAQAGRSYPLQLRVRAVAERQYFTGGVSGTNWNRGGTISGPGFLNDFRLTGGVGGVTLWLNRTASAETAIAMDYRVTETVPAGATLALRATSGSDSQSSAPGVGLAAPGLDAPGWQYMRVDCERIAFGNIAIFNHLNRWGLDARVEWSEDPTRQLAYDLRAQQIGHGRKVSEALRDYVQTTCTIRIDCSGADETHALLAFLAEMRGSGTVFWLPAAERFSTISAAMAASTTQLDLTPCGLIDLFEHSPILHLWLVGPQGQRCWAQAASPAIVGAVERLMWVTPLPEAVDGNWDVHQLRAVRLASDEVEIAWGTENECTVTLRVIESPWAAAHIEASARIAEGYRIWRLDSTGAVQDESWWTSADHNIAALVGVSETERTFLTGPWDRGDIASGITGEAEGLEVTSILEAGVSHPLSSWIPSARPDRWFLQILELDALAADPVAATPIWTGLIDKVQAKGSTLKVSCKTRLDKTRRQVPCFRCQKMCNLALYGSACGVNRATWAHAVTVTSISADGLAMDVTAASGLSGLPGNWFAAGDATHAAEDEAATIQGSHTNPTMGDPQQHALALVAPFLTPLEVGDTLSIAPGCNLTPDSNGCAKFSNNARYGGHPFITTNLSMRAVPAGNTGGKGK